MALRWRVQANWTVNGEQHSYQPVWCDSADEAERVRADMADTLSHFPTLRIDVAQAQFRRPAIVDPPDSPAPTIHAMGSDGQPICNAPVDEAKACVATEWFRDVESTRRCADCAALL